MIDTGPALSMIAFIAATLVYVSKLQGMDYYLRTRHPQVLDDEDSLRYVLRWRYWADLVVFPHRRLRARLDSERIRDKALDARITSLVRWNRLAIALYLAVIVYAVAYHW